MRITLAFAVGLALVAGRFAQEDTAITNLGETVHEPVMRDDGLVFWTSSTGIRNESGVLVAKPPPNQVGDNP